MKGKKYKSVRVPGEEPSPDGGWRNFLPLVAILVVFAPILAGWNFLPVRWYPSWGPAQSRNSDLPPALDQAHQEKAVKARWMGEWDPSPLALFWPQDLFVARCLRQGDLPLWDPHTGAGTPTFDGGQFRPLNPFRWPFYLAPGPWLFCLTLVFQVAFGAVGALRWLRRMGFSPHEAALGAGAFSVNPWVLERIIHLDAPAYLCLPWVLLGFAPARWGCWWSVARAALPLVLMGHMAHPESCVLVVATAGAFYLFGGSGSGDERGSWIDRLKILTCVGVATLAALSLLWVPPLDLLRTGFTYKEVPELAKAFYHSLSWKALASPGGDLFLPPAVVGIVAVALVKPRRYTLFWSGVLSVSALGMFTIPLLGEGVAKALRSATHAPAFYWKSLFFAAVAFLVPAGARALSEASARARTLAWSAALAACCSTLVVVASTPLPAAVQFHWPPLAAVAVAAGFLGMAGLAGSFRFTPKSGGLAAGLVLLAWAFPIALDHLPWNRVPWKGNDLVEWMGRELPHVRTVSLGGTALVPYRVVPPNQGQAFGIRCGEQVAALFPNDYFRAFSPPGRAPTMLLFDAPDKVRFRELGAEVLLLPNEVPFPDSAPLHRGTWCSAYAIPGAEGRVYFARKVEAWSAAWDGDGIVVHMEDSGPRTAFLELPGTHPPKEFPPPAPEGAKIRFLEDGLSLVRMASETPSPALLVLRDSWSPWWEVLVDGNPSPCYRVNRCFRGVPVPAGTHEVLFRYRPLHTYWAALGSLLVTVGLLVLAWKKKPVPEPP